MCVTFLKYNPSFRNVLLKCIHFGICFFSISVRTRAEKCNKYDKKLPEDVTPLRVVETYSPHLGRCGCNSSSVNLLLTFYETLYYKTMNDYKFVEPKTQASNRTIYIDADTIKELQEWKAVQAKVLPNCGFVLSYNSTPTSKTTLPRALEKLANLAGVHRIKIHALRHSHASLLISMGENPLLIKERLGHEKIQTTLGTYGHLYPNTNIEIAKKLTGVLSYQSASQSIANYTSNQHTAMYHKEI